ncbi:hypothetical protein APHAL10511_002472 [Amanita phalloides]|nr:hypothetical protein APHAL10511_002472 [Amanita phalloides]
MREDLRSVLNRSEGVTIPLTTTVPRSQQQPSMFNTTKDFPPRQHDSAPTDSSSSPSDAGVESKVISVPNPGATVQSQERSVVFQEKEMPPRQPICTLTDGSTSSSCDDAAESREAISISNPTGTTQ